MTYKHLRKYSYNDPIQYFKEVDERLNNITAVKLPFFIHPYLRESKQNDTTFQLFYLPIKEISFLREKLYENSKEITKLLGKLPTVAQQKVFVSNLIEEIKATNDIEGVQSTRKEIGEAIAEINENITSSKRFHGLVNLYMKFQDSEYSDIKSVEDIRDIYDTLLNDEIENEDLPDGELFRTSKVFVSKNGKHVHEGVGNQKNVENDIFNALEKLVTFMNAHDVPSLEKCIASHYYLEYIHPFYDGNGRLGRFIACSYLSRKLDSLSAISFSSAIKKQKGVYGSAFSEVSHPKNHGELTLFIIEMFDLLSKGQENIIDSLRAGSDSLKSIANYLENLELKETQHNILLILSQDYLFSASNDKLVDQDIANICNVGRKKLNTAMNSLIENDFVVQVKQKPKSHVLSESFINQISTFIN